MVYCPLKSKWLLDCRTFLISHVLHPRLIRSDLPRNRPEMKRDLASAYVLCLRTLIVPNLQRDKGRSQKSRKQTKWLGVFYKVDFRTKKLQNYRNMLYIWSRIVRPIEPYERKAIQNIKSPGGNLRHFFLRVSEVIRSHGKPRWMLVVTYNQALAPNMGPRLSKTR